MRSRRDRASPARTHSPTYAVAWAVTPGREWSVALPLLPGRPLPGASDHRRCHRERDRHPRRAIRAGRPSAHPKFDAVRSPAKRPASGSPNDPLTRRGPPAGPLPARCLRDSPNDRILDYNLDYNSRLPVSSGVVTHLHHCRSERFPPSGAVQKVGPWLIISAAL